MQQCFLQNKSCLKLSLFCMRTDDWLNFHVKFQSIHVNIISTTHHFSFFFLFSSFFLLHISKTCQTEKNNLVKLKTNAYIHVMCTNTVIIECHVKHALHVTWNMRYNSKSIWSWWSVPILLWNMSTASKTNKNKWSMVFVWSWRKNFSFHVTHVSVSVLRVGCSTLKWMNPLKNCT